MVRSNRRTQVCITGFGSQGPEQLTDGVRAAIISAPGTRVYT